MKSEGILSLKVLKRGYCVHFSYMMRAKFHCLREKGKKAVLNEQGFIQDFQFGVGNMSGQCFVEAPHSRGVWGPPPGNFGSLHP